MTVQELYDYAFKNLLLDKEVKEVQYLYLNKKYSTNSLNQLIDESISLFNGIVEYSYEDVIKLFSQ